MTNEYRIETTELLPVFRIYVDGRRTSAFIPYPHGKGTVPDALYEEAERLVCSERF